MNMLLDIKPVTIETSRDFSAILEGANAWQKARGSEGWSGPFDDEWMLPRIERGELFLAYMGDTPVSAFRVIWEDRSFWGDREVGDSIYLHSFAVRRQSAGLGIGKIIIDMVSDMGRDRGRTKIRLDCFNKNKKLILFYENIGFFSTGIIVMRGRTINLMERIL